MHSNYAQNIAMKPERISIYAIQLASRIAGNTLLLPRMDSIELIAKAKSN